MPTDDSDLRDKSSRGNASQFFMRASFVVGYSAVVTPGDTPKRRHPMQQSSVVSRLKGVGAVGSDLDANEKSREARKAAAQNRVRSPRKRAESRVGSVN